MFTYQVHNQYPHSSEVIPSFTAAPFKACVLLTVPKSLMDHVTIPWTLELHVKHTKRLMNWSSIALLRSS